MIKILNNYISIDRSESDKCAELFDAFLIHFRIYDTESEKSINLYTLKGDVMYLPRGYEQFIPDFIPRQDLSSKDMICNNHDEDYYKELSYFSDEIILRDDQIIAIRKMKLAKRGIIQMSTGSGKTEVMAGFFKDIINDNGIVGSIILEPTIGLVDATVERLNSYGIPAIKYSDIRKDIEYIDGIVVTHPKSLGNDLKKNPDLFKKVKIFLSDEGHHLRADTWNSLLDSLVSIEYSLALSASIIEECRIPITDFKRLDYSELSVVGVTGNVLLNVNPSYYIERGILSTPVLFRLNNSACEPIDDLDNWHDIRRGRLESITRSETIAKAASFLSTIGYKTLIMVNTKDHAYKIMKLIGEIGLGDSCRCSFGGKIYFKLTDDLQDVEKCKESPDKIMDDFKKGDLKIFIGTSHIYEGTDIPNLDVAIISGLGKTLRRVIQGVGRVIRKSKTGKYAYIIDFNDYGDKTLARHSQERLDICKELIGVQDSMIYSNVEFDQFKYHFTKLEGRG